VTETERTLRPEDGTVTIRRVCACAARRSEGGV